MDRCDHLPRPIRPIRGLRLADGVDACAGGPVRPDRPGSLLCRPAGIDAGFSSWRMYLEVVLGALVASFLRPSILIVPMMLAVHILYLSRTGTMVCGACVYGYLCSPCSRSIRC